MTLLNVVLSRRDINEFAEFLRPAMQINPEERATAKELLAHAWLKQ
jgi:serine/threonine protein kinase